jgi:hypothetical protein
MNNPTRRSTFNPTGCLEYRELAEASILSSPWSKVASALTAGYSGAFLNNCIDSTCVKPDLQRVQSLIEPDLSLSDNKDMSPASISPLAFSAKSSSNSEDNPIYDEAMQGIYKHEYIEAAKVELHTLQNDLDCWELVPRTPEMNVLLHTSRVLFVLGRSTRANLIIAINHTLWTPQSHSQIGSFRHLFRTKAILHR